MDAGTAKPKAAASFLRKFGGREGDLTFIELQSGLRVRDAMTGAWIDYDIGGWRIRAIAWNAPEPQ